MKKTEAYMPRPGHTCRVNKPGDPWHKKQVAVCVVSQTGKAACNLWSVLNQALQSNIGSVKRSQLMSRDYMPHELVFVNLGLADPKDAWAPRVGKSYVFVREGHEWTGCEVFVLRERKRGFEVARCCQMCEWLMDSRLTMGKPHSWVATADELC